MAAQALYRRYRPQSFDDVIGQAPVTQTLRHAVGSDRLAHAYLFTGPRGTGKTSVARILARAVNCTAGAGVDKPCNRCGICRSMAEGRSLDLIEIDAASNTGVDDVRDLRDKIGFSPNEGRYKVYIVDEVHMLSTAAFNALLKTLEEPPGHALFILATTEPHKIPDTILSRCQRHDFRRVGVITLVPRLERLCAAEGAVADRAALELIARSATGSIRDAESLLDQLISTGEPVTVEAVQAVLGTPAGELVADLVDAVLARDAAAGLTDINAALDRGTDARQLQSRLLDYLRGLLLIQTGIKLELLNVADEQLERMRGQAERLPMAALVAAIHRFNDARPAADRSLPSLPLELALVETVLALAGVDAAAGAAVAQSNIARSVSAQPPPSPVRSVSAQSGPTQPGPTQPGPAQSDPAQSKPAQLKPAPSVPAASESRSPLSAATASPTSATPPAKESTADPGTERPAAEILARTQAQWGAVITAVERRDRNTAALLKDCRPLASDGSSITLGFFYEFHCKRMSEPGRTALVTEALETVVGARLSVVCVVASASSAEHDARPRSKTDQAKTDPLVRHAIDALGAQVTGVQSTVDDE
jgi:DNA polymerase-3 subunit gamma/tau